MTLREFLDLVKDQDLDAPLSFRVVHTDGDGDVEETEFPSGDSGEILHGFCARGAGYEECFRTPEDLERHKASVAERGLVFRSWDWVPAVRVVLHVKTSW